MSDPLAPLRHTDIYLIDQILKGRYRAGETLLDAGAGGGRNLPWLLASGLTVYAVDRETAAVNALQAKYPDLPAGRFQTADVAALPFESGFFDHIVCCAVLHFAENTQHFHRMLAELLRVLRKGGSLFIRVASDIGLENKVQSLGHGVYQIPDGSVRFLLTRSLLDELLGQYPVELLEPFKTVNVADIRCMSTLLLGLKA